MHPLVSYDCQVILEVMVYLALGMYKCLIKHEHTEQLAHLVALGPLASYLTRSFELELTICFYFVLFFSPELPESSASGETFSTGDSG